MHLQALLIMSSGSVFVMATLKPFVLNLTDLNFILDQLNFLPLFDASGNAIIGWDGTGAVYDRSGTKLWDSDGGEYKYRGVTLDAGNHLALLGPSFPTNISMAARSRPSKRLRLTCWAGSIR
jgi:hypothetical protein